MTCPILYHFEFSTPSRAALLVIRNLKLDVDIKIVDIYNGENLSESFLKINPQHTIPTLDDGGFVLWESRAIASYLVDSYLPGNALYPIDTRKRALIDQRLFFDTGTLWARTEAIVYPAYTNGIITISDEKRKSLYEALDFLDTFLKENTWVAGNNVTIADLSILASTSSLDHAGLNLNKWSHIAAWYNRCRGLPGWAENDDGAKMYGEKVKSLLRDDKF